MLMNGCNVIQFYLGLFPYPVDSGKCMVYRDPLLKLVIIPSGDHS